MVKKDNFTKKILMLIAVKLKENNHNQKVIHKNDALRIMRFFRFTKNLSRELLREMESYGIIKRINLRDIKIKK